jgi:hypothetical protein
LQFTPKGLASTVMVSYIYEKVTLLADSQLIKKMQP